MSRKKKRQQAQEQAEAGGATPQQAPVRTSGGYGHSELTTFDGKGNPTVIVYTTDSVGRSVKTPRGRRRSH